MRVTVKRLSEAKRASPWRVSYYRKRRFRKFFKSEAAAQRHAAEIRKILQLGGDPSQLVPAQRLIAGKGYDLLMVVREGLESLARRGVPAASGTATFAELCDAVVARAERKRRRPITIEGYKSTFATLKKEFGPLLAASITEQQVQAYLDTRRNHKGGEASPYTRKSLLSVIRMALRLAGFSNPLPDVDPRVPLTRDILCFSIDDIKLLFTTARPEELGALALAIFAGLRPLMLNALPEDAINVQEQSINIPMNLAKNHRHTTLETVLHGHDRPSARPGPPPILWEWLKLYPYKKVNWANLRNRLKRALRARGRQWIHDGCRHSAASYYRARYGVPATADLLTHRTNDLVMRDYAAPVRQAKAEEFFSLGPSAVGLLNKKASRYESRIQWPPASELTRLVWEMPITHIARRLVCSDVLVLKKCRQLLIQTPPSGYWTIRKHAERQAADKDLHCESQEPADAEREGALQSRTECKLAIKTEISNGGSTLEQSESEALREQRDECAFMD